MIWNVPKIWQGGECFIIGGGTSITKQFKIPSGTVKGVLNKTLSIASYIKYLEELRILEGGFYSNQDIEIGVSELIMGFNFKEKKVEKVARFFYSNPLIVNLSETLINVLPLVEIFSISLK
jgi:hypothetical protein